MRLGFACLLITLLAALSAGAAGATREVAATSPRAWSEQVCKSLVTWEKTLTTRSNTFSKAIDKTNNLVRVRAQFVAFLNGATTLTADLVKEVDKAGSPAIANGARIEAIFRRLLAKIRDQFRADTAVARRLPPADPSKFAAEASTLGKKIDKEGSAAGKAFSIAGKKYSTPALDRIWNTVPSCRAM